MGVSKNRGYPQIIHVNRVFHYKPSILGYYYFWKHPYIHHPDLYQSNTNFDLVKQRYHHFSNILLSFSASQKNIKNTFDTNHFLSTLAQEGFPPKKAGTHCGSVRFTFHPHWRLEGKICVLQIQFSLKKTLSVEDSIGIENLCLFSLLRSIIHGKRIQVLLESIIFMARVTLL